MKRSCVRVMGALLCWFTIQSRMIQVWIWFMDILTCGQTTLCCLRWPSNLMLIIHAWWHTFECVCSWLCLRRHSSFCLAGNGTDCPRRRSSSGLCANGLCVQICKPSSAGAGYSRQSPRLQVIGHACTCGYFLEFLLWQSCWQTHVFITVGLLNSWAHPVMSEIEPSPWCPAVLVSPEYLFAFSWIWTFHELQVVMLCVIAWH